LSRPQTIKKVVQAAVTMGIKELHLVRSERGEKSYLSAKVLSPNLLAKEIELGLSQAVDTVPPHVEVHDRFLPFLEDLLPARLRALEPGGIAKLVAHTSACTPAKQVFSSLTGGAHVVLAVGPEAGWSDFEIQKFEAQGFSPISLGPRMLRVETAASVLLGLSLTLHGVTT
jgi:RsmE family RNA methyltransferase